MLNALLTGVASDSFYGLMKSLVDRIIEFKTKDTDETIEQRVRVRLMRGSSYDASWHRLRLLDNGRLRSAIGSVCDFMKDVLYGVLGG